MSAAEAETEDEPRGERMSFPGAVALARAYVDAYNNRDLEAMLAVQDENVVSHPAPLFGHRPHYGHAGVRAWWQEMVDRDRWYTVVIRDIRVVGADRVAVLGEIRQGGERLSPWGVVVRIRDGLIVESRSYLSDEELLDGLGLLG